MSALAGWLAEIEAAARRLDEPADRWETYGRAAAEAEAVVSRLADLRARVAAELAVDGWSLARIAAELGVSRARAQQLVRRGGDVK